MPETVAGTTTGREIVITRVYDAPRELVWKAWTEPEQLAGWWGARGWSTRRSSVVMDVRPGGTFRLTSVRDADGREMDTEAVYQEVVELERLAFAELPRDDCHHGAVGAVTFTDLGDGRTEMVFRTTMQTTDEIRRTSRAGLESAFERLAEHLA
jgi:uncharacterized protein YndB with AHSA1/START domain